MESAAAVGIKVIGGIPTSRSLSGYGRGRSNTAVYTTSVTKITFNRPLRPRTGGSGALVVSVVASDHRLRTVSSQRLCLGPEPNRG